MHIVLNSVTEDSRVLKCAWSLANAGWDVLVCGATASSEVDSLTIGYARIWRLKLKPVVNQAQTARVLRKLRYYKRRFEAKYLKAKEPMIPNYRMALKALLPVAKDFQPDVVHAHDYTALPIAGAIVESLRKAGQKVELVYDAHEYVPGVPHLTEPMMKMYSAEERKYSAISAAVLSVSDGMSDLLIPHLNLVKRPEIVANDPLVAGAMPSTRNLRNDCGIGPDVPLMVYSGAVAPQRGVHTAAEALRQLPGVHLVVIANPKNATVKKLLETYSDVADRFHVQPYVPNSELVAYLSTATVGLIPIIHRLNHEISLITKFGEYMQARLPILVSDVKTMAAEVRKLGNGEVFIAEDVADFVSAVKKILDNPGKYSSVYTREMLNERSWERQAEGLLEIYNRISSAAPTAREAKPFVLGVTKPGLQ
jgi:glycogen synthase